MPELEITVDEIGVVGKDKSNRAIHKKILTLVIMTGVLVLVGAPGELPESLSSILPTTLSAAGCHLKESHQRRD